MAEEQDANNPNFQANNGPFAGQQPESLGVNWPTAMGTGITTTDGGQTYITTTTPIAGSVNVVCFAQHTRIKTKRGARKVSDLREGDLVLTRDNGYQPIRWIGKREVKTSELKQHPNLRPIRIFKGALGGDVPTRNLTISPQHRLLLTDPALRKRFGTKEALIAAKDLLHVLDVKRVNDLKPVTYYHFLFDRHEVVYAEDAAAESFFIGEQAKRTLPCAQYEEILRIFPELAEREDPLHKPARPLLTGKAAKNCVRRALTLSFS